jgi:pimeloyl-ACP methyl ester carboxylesterase
VHFFLKVSRAVLMVSITLAPSQRPGVAQGKEHPVKYPTLYRTKQVDGLSIFYREAGPKDAPALLLLHGLPSSSRMFEPLFSRLSDRYHLVAPDYPGFGHSDGPDPKTFPYTFDHIAETMNHFREALGLSRYTLYMQDYGNPVGFRITLAHPGRIEALIVQDARFAQRRSGGDLENAAGLLGRSRHQRKCASSQSIVAGHDADAPCRERPQRGTL